MYLVVKRKTINGVPRLRVLTKRGDFILERFIGDCGSLTGPHKAREYRTKAGAERAAAKFPGSEIYLTTTQTRCIFV